MKTVRDLIVEMFGTDNPSPEAIEEALRDERALLRESEAARQRDEDDDEPLPRSLRDQLRALTRHTRRSDDS